MTVNRENLAPRTPRIEDKHGRSLHEGDVVEFVYGGDHHRARVEQLHPDPIHPDRLTVSITICVHAGSVTRVRETDKSADEKPSRSSTKSAPRP